ncbi:hypothetical protein QN277_008406 [Acacia crassicarpa]|uniref:Terpene synthase N-terminal domain-containing protein n=1 Tax=Acacia crassicarpa TaxID=499986 RepID=A0AAE1IQG4_9FABA|nr:hypothetical protein QN277_008406 [Acacia crassicarpa]
MAQASPPSFLNSSSISLSFRKHNKPGCPISFHTICYNHNNSRRLASQENLSLPSSSRRNSANYQPTLWSHDFLQSLNNGFTDERYEAKERNLLEDVRRIIVNEKTEPLAKLELIDDVQRLGLGHRFEKEIKDALHTYVSLEPTSRHTRHSTPA